jgi:hypothetical protein
MEDLLITLIIIGGLSYAIYEYTPLHCVFSPLECAEDTASGLFQGVSQFFNGLLHSNK